MKNANFHMELSRRSVLRSAGIGAGVSVSGCSIIESQNMTSTKTSTSPTENPSIIFNAEILQQETTDHPARLRAFLENGGSKTARVGFGPALLFTDNTASDDLEWPTQLVLDPNTSIGPWAEPTQDPDGCWRFPKDGNRLVQSSFNWRNIPSGDSIEETYDIYTNGTSGSCLPEGTYRFQDKGAFRNETNSMIFTLSLEISMNQLLTINSKETHVSVK